MTGHQPKAIYISGPMRNQDGFNFPAFFMAEDDLRRAFPDAQIENPARADIAHFSLQSMLDEDPTGLNAGRYLAETAEFGPDDLREALGRDLAFICQHCDLLVLLPGWQESRGAQAELAAAQAMSVRVAEWTPPSEAMQSLPEALDLPMDQPPTEAPNEAPGPVSASPGAPPGPEGILAAVQEMLRGSEVRATSPTGGQKGVKLAAFDQISPEVEWEVAEHFGKGARKYDAHNFRKGYPWSQSYSALRRHLAAFWSGKEFDTCPDNGAGCQFVDSEGHPFTSEPGTCYNHTGSRHIIAAVWHAMVLAEFSNHRRDYDDRYVYDND